MDLYGIPPSYILSSMRLKGIVEVISMKSQHPLVSRYVADARGLGAEVYAGKSFAVVPFADGARVEIRAFKEAILR